MNRICQSTRIGSRTTCSTKLASPNSERTADAFLPSQRWGTGQGSALPFAPHQDHRPPNFLKDFVPRWPQPPHALRTPCLAAVVAFSERPNVEWCAASINSGPLGFVAEDNARPGHQQPRGHPLDHTLVGPGT